MKILHCNSFGWEGPGAELAFSLGCMSISMTFWQLSKENFIKRTLDRDTLNDVVWYWYEHFVLLPIKTNNKM